MLIDLASRLAARFGERADRNGGWDQYGRLRGGFALFGLRYRLRKLNLYDDPAADPPTVLHHRMGMRMRDGRDTDVLDPEMGAIGTHFGRNGPAVTRDARPRRELPDPAVVSEELLARRAFMPAKTLNLLAAAWVQFEVHDWFQHRMDVTRRRHPMVPGQGSTDHNPRFISDQTHWWDASQLYGAEPKFAKAIRKDVEPGRVRTGKPLLKAIEDAMERKPVAVPNFWLGLALFHELFAREHNAICDMLEREEPHLRGDDLFNAARLINAAVMAKIHTIEWTPAIISHTTTVHASFAIWYGILGRRMKDHFGRIGASEVFSGIPGSRTHHDGVRYSLTEEFVAVYRMHPLIPDEVRFRRVEDDKALGPSLPFQDLAVAAGPPKRPRERLDEIGHENAWYSLGLAHPGEISLHNFPEFLRRLPLLRTRDDPNPGRVDLAARDIERMREAALPRYNQFRRVFRLPPADTFMAMTDGDEKLARDIQNVYRHPDDVDLMVGLFAERKPEGFGFSDTAFRVFLLMAARRLRSDRFFTADFRKAVYTPAGMRWIQKATFSDMLVRHYPGLAPRLEGVANPFSPWSWAP